MSQKAQKAQKPKRLRSDGWVILHKRVEGWREFPDTPRMVFRTQAEARVYACQVLGWALRITRNFWVVPWLGRRWKVVLFKATSDKMDGMIGDALRAALNLIPNTSDVPDLAITLQCECGVTYCDKTMVIPMGLYEEGRLQNCVFRHRDCSVPPEFRDVFLTQFGYCQVWQEGGVSDGK